MLLKQKKAMSPVVPTIALVVFSVLLGLIVMEWGASYEDSEKPACKDMGFKILEINNAKQVCYKENTIEMSIENTGYAGINSLVFNVIGGNDIDKVYSAEIIGVADISKIKLNYNPGIGAVKKIRIIPEAVSMGKSYICLDKSVDVEEIKVC